MPDQHSKPGDECLLIDCFLDSLHSCICQDQQLLCKLQQLSSGFRGRLHQRCAGEVTVSCRGSSWENACLFATWLLSNARLLKSLQFSLEGAEFELGPRRHAAEQMVAAMLMGAAAAANAAGTPLRLQHCKLAALGPDSSTILQALAHLPSLTSLEATVYSSETETVPKRLPKALASLTGLKQLELWCDQDDTIDQSTELYLAAFAAATASFTQLTRLKLSGQPDVESLSKLPASLLELDVSLHDYDTEVPIQLGQLTKLTLLQLGSSAIVEPGSTLPTSLQVLTAGSCSAQTLMQLQQLRQLTLRGCTAAAGTLQQLSKLTPLSYVELGYSDCGTCEPPVLAANASCIAWPVLQLKNLVIASSSTETQEGLTAAALEHLGRCTGLTNLAAIFSGAGGVAPSTFVATLKQLTALQHLYLQPPTSPFASRSWSSSTTARRTAAMHGEAAGSSPSDNSSSSLEVILHEVAKFPNLKTLQGFWVD